MQQAVFDPNNFHLSPYGVEGIKKRVVQPQIENLTLQLVIFSAKDTINGVQNDDNAY